MVGKLFEIQTSSHVSIYHPVFCPSKTRSPGVSRVETLRARVSARARVSKRLVANTGYFSNESRHANPCASRGVKKNRHYLSRKRTRSSPQSEFAQLAAKRVRPARREASSPSSPRSEFARSASHARRSGPGSEMRSPRRSHVASHAKFTFVAFQRRRRRSRSERSDPCTGPEGIARRCQGREAVARLRATPGNRIPCSSRRRAGSLYLPRTGRASVRPPSSVGLPLSETSWPKAHRAPGAPRAHRASPDCRALRRRCRRSNYCMRSRGKERGRPLGGRGLKIPAW